jgi:hypothetical protein
MSRWDKDRATGVSSLTNEEPLVVVQAGVDIMWEVVRENRGDGHDGVFRERETPLHCRGRGSVRERSSGAEDGHIGRGWGVCSRWGSKVFMT